MNIKKNICSVMCTVIAASMLCIPTYAAEDQFTGTTKKIEQAAIKVEDGIIAYNPEGISEDLLNKMDELLAGTVFYPFEIQYEEHLGRPLIIKSYRVPADYNPMVLVDKDFEEDGYYYKKQDIIEDIPDIIFDKKVVAKSITFTTDDNKQETLKAALEPVLEYDEDGYIGQLTIDYESIVSFPSGETNYSYPIVKTKEINNLESNDVAYIRKEMNGLSLTDVDWELQTGSDGRVPDLYTAYATYKGTGYGKNVNEYVNTACYMGTVYKETKGDKICSVIYKGERNFPRKSVMIIVVGSALVTVIVTIAVKKNDHKPKRGESENA